MAGGRIYQRTKADGSLGTWSAVVDVGRVPTDQGGTRRKQATKGGFPTKGAAQRWARDQLSKLDRGTYVTPSRQTVSEYLADWLKAFRARPSTLESYARNVRHHLVPALGTLRLDHLGPEHVRVMVKDLETVKGLSPRSVRRSLPPEVRHDMTTWTGAEVATFLERIKDDALYTPVLLAVTTGLRRGEVLGLRWRDLDLATGRASVRQTVGDVLVDGKHAAVIGEPKTARGRRTVELRARTVAALRRHKLAQYTGPGYVSQDLVFSYPDGSPLHPAAFRMQFSRAVAKSGLPMIRFHDLRHTYATIRLANGDSPKAVQESLGHSSVSITLDTYSHVMPGMQRDDADRVEAAIFGA
jgi:integrase